MFPPDLLDQARRVLATCREAGLTVVTAESCTGGLVTACLTAIPGSSDVVERGFVTYSDSAKTDMLGVDEAVIDRHGAVSEEVARAMVDGAIARSTADLGVSITGIAGPGGGTSTKPVGLVHIAAARRHGEATHRRELFPGNRVDIRVRSVEVALQLLERLSRR